MVKKNKAPKKGKKGKTSKATMLQKQTVSQNVKVNIYKPTRVPREYKKQLGRDGASVPRSSFQIVNNQPQPLLNNNFLGNARPVSASPFERLLVNHAVQDNRQLEVAKLRNSLESSRLKAIEREPALEPARRGETESERFMAFAKSASDVNHEPFKVRSLGEQDPVVISFKGRSPQEGTFDDYTVLPPTRGSYERGSSSTVESVLPRGESATFREEPQEQVTIMEEPQQFTPVDSEERVPYSGAFGEPGPPNPLTAYVADQDYTWDDVIGPQQPNARPGHPIWYSDAKHVEERENKARERKGDKHYKQSLAKKLFSALKNKS